MKKIPLLSLLLSFISLGAPLVHAMEQPKLSHAMEQPELSLEVKDPRSRSITLRLSQDAHNVGECVDADDLILEKASGEPLSIIEEEGIDPAISSSSPSQPKRPARLQRQPGIKDLRLCLPQNSVPRILLKETIERLFMAEATKKFTNDQGKQVYHTPRKIRALTRSPHFEEERFTKGYIYHPIRLFPDDPRRQNVWAALKLDPDKKGYIYGELEKDQQIYGEFESLEVRIDSTIQAERSFLVRYRLKQHASYILNEEVLREQKKIRGLNTPNPSMLRIAAKKFTVVIYLMDEEGGQ
jgi:hypothetical protein